MRVEEYQGTEAIRSLSREWEDFGQRAEGCVPFLDPTYIALWSRILGRPAESRVVTVWSDGTLQGYAPFMETVDPFGPLSVRTVKLIGNNVGYPGDVLYADIVASEPQKPVVEAILAHVKGRWKAGKWDFGYLRSGSMTCTIAQKMGGFASGDSHDPPQDFVTVQLPLDWTEYLGAMSANVRRNYRRYRRKLGKLGDLQVRMDREPSVVSQRVTELIGNHLRWWRGTSLEGKFGDEAVHRFLSEAAELLAGRGQYLAFTLELDEKPIAWDTGPFDGRRYFGQLLCYDKTFASSSPGLILSIAGVRRLISIGARVLELGPGLDQRKRSLGGKPTPHVRIKGYWGWVRPLARMWRAWARRRAAS